MTSSLFSVRAARFPSPRSWTAALVGLGLALSAPAQPARADDAGFESAAATAAETAPITGTEREVWETMRDEAGVDGALAKLSEALEGLRATRDPEGVAERARLLEFRAELRLLVPDAEGAVEDLEQAVRLREYADEGSPAGSP